MRLDRQLAFMLDLDGADTSDVMQREAARRQDAADQEPTMTVAGVLFAAHHCDAVARGAVDQTIDPGEKAGGGGDEVVADVVICVVVGVLAWAAAEFFADEDVLHGVFLECAFQRCAVEVR